MSTYRYTLTDYHAVKSADIVIDGITVLAGENGCGKSTLARWLYYLVNGSRRFEEFLCKEYVKTLVDLSNRWEFVSRDIRRNSSERTASGTTLSASPLSPIRQSLRQLAQGSSFDEEWLEKVSTLYDQMLQLFSEQLTSYFDKVKDGPRRDRALSFLGIREDNKQDGQQIVDLFVEKSMRQFHRITGSLQSGLENRFSDIFFETVKNSYQESDEAPARIQLYEDNVELISDKHVSALFNLQRAVYVDTPMALTNEYADNVFWDELRDYVLEKRKELGLAEKKILHRIKGVIHGEAKLVGTDSPIDEEELRYVSSDNQINIKIEKTATGFKTFTYLQRLLENGYLNKETLLLIDEPEAHLHPQWIVEYARLLVLLSKELGLKIMLASHNPDMVAALRAVAEREGMLSRTHFYIAKPADDTPFHYVYQDLGSDIGEIFTSFNIALSRIKLYGACGLS